MNTVFPITNANVRTHKKVVGSKTIIMYCLKDVCQAINLKNHRAKKKHLLMKHWDGVTQPDAMGREQKYTFVTLGGVCRIMRHTQKESELCDQFMEWLTEEVAPKILLEGFYKMKREQDDQISNLTMQLQKWKLKSEGYSVAQIVESDNAMKCVEGVNVGTIIRQYFSAKLGKTCPDILTSEQRFEVVNHIRKRLRHHNNKIYFC